MALATIIIAALNAAIVAVCDFYASSLLVQVAAWVALFAVAAAAPFMVRLWARGKEKMQNSKGGGKKVLEGFLHHLAELSVHMRWAVYSVLAVLFFLPTTIGVFDWMCEGTWSLLGLALSYFTGAGYIYSILAMPLRENLPEAGGLIAIGTWSPAFVLMKTAFFTAVCVTMPFILNEMWSFVAPGLYPWYDDKKERQVYNEEGAEKGRDEKRLALGLITTSAALFYAGMLFAYFVVFQLVFKVIAAVTPETVNWTPDINEFFGSMLLMFFGFGLVFEVPVAMFILARAGVVEVEDMRKARPYVIVGAFVVAAVVTPPDVLSQFLLAIPCWILYEFGLWFTSKWGVKKESPKTAVAD